MLEVGGAPIYGEISTRSAIPGLTAEELSDLSGVDTGTETLVQQQFQDEVDINTIMKRFMGGIMPVFGSAQAMFGDFTGVDDFDSAVEKVDKLRAGFMLLPPDLRLKFANNPGRFVEHVKDMSQEEFAELVKAAVPVAPVVTPGAAGTAAP